MNNRQNIKAVKDAKVVVCNAFDEAPALCEMELEENSHVTYITTNLGNTDDNKNELIANLKEHAHLEIYNIITSNKDNYIHQTIHLNGASATVQMMNLLLLTKEAKLDSKIEIYHHAKATSSDLSNYVIAKDEASTALNNNAKIEKGCSKSVAHQQTKGLTLSKQAKIKALPNLYIDEYDVIANHACSIGSINKEDLFYLMSRGMNQEEASTIIVMGYVQPILDHIEDDMLKEKIRASFAKYLLN